MSVQTKMSAKGQVVIPKAVRQRLDMSAGDELDVVERLDGVLLRKSAQKSCESFEAVTARIRSIIHYDGPPVSIDDMKQSLADMWADGGPRWDR